MGDPHDTDFLNKTRAWYAAGERDVDSLCRAGKSAHGVYVIDEHDEGVTRLYCASRLSCRSTLRWLIDHGADINYRIGDRIRTRPAGGKSALHAALAHGGFDVASMLLDAGARIDAVDYNGRTTLHEAVNSIYVRDMQPVAACKRLLSLGASLYATDVAGETPEAYARRCGYTHSANLLADVRGAGGWKHYIAAPRDALLALRRELPALRESGRATAPSSVPAHERLFLQAPDDVFSHIIAFWRSDRDL